jgi:hypothetical protein
LLDQLHAGHFRQAKIDDRDIERHFASKIDAFLAIAGRIDREAIALQARGEGFPQRRFVFHQQYAH